MRLPLSHWGLEETAGGLRLGPHSIVELADKFGTPFYLFEEERLRANARAALETAHRTLPYADIFYSLKTNPHPRVFEILREEGLGAEAISSRELRNAFAAGFDAERMVLNGPGKTDADLHLASTSGVLIQVDSASEARALARIAKKLKKPVQAGIRIKPGVFESQALGIMRWGVRGDVFGLDPAGKEFKEAVNTLSKAEGVRLVSLSAHIGTGIIIAEPYRRMARKMVEVRRELSSEGIDISILDIGGGFAVRSEVRYQESAFNTRFVGEPIEVPPPEEIASFSEVCEAISSELTADPPSSLLMEPGRLLVSDAFHLVTRVTRLKEEGGVRFAILDSGRFQNAFFVAWGHHEILHAGAPCGAGDGPYTLVGPLCAGIDVFARSRTMPRLSEGDVIIVMDLGAYNLSAQSRWAFDPAPVVALQGGEAHLLES
jgi:diaminopimelate decarboxylase